MLSDNPDRKGLKSKQRRAVGSKNKSWSDSQKIEAVTTYLALGELRLTANVLKIPEVTLRNWKSKDWWKEIESELRHQDNLVLSVRLKKIIGNTLDVVEDRLANGNFIYDQKTGQLVRKPVDVKDAHKISMEMLDKHEELINKQPTTISAEALDDKLDKLAAKFAEIARAAKAPVVVTDVLEGSFTEITNDQENKEDGGGYRGTNPLESGSDISTDGQWSDDDGDDFPYEEDEDEETTGTEPGNRT